MSDISDYFNQNQGYYNALGHMAAIGQRNQLLAAQRQQIAVLEGQYRVVFMIDGREAARSVEVPKNVQTRLEVDTTKIVWPRFGTRLINLSTQRSQALAILGTPTKTETGLGYPWEDRFDSTRGDLQIFWDEDGRMNGLNCYSGFDGWLPDGSKVDKFEIEK